MKKRTAITALLAGSAIALCLAGDAKADTKIVSTVSVSGQMGRGGGAAAAPMTATIYYKGPDARLEASGGIVLLFKGVDGLVYTLNTTNKTYYTKTYAEMTTPRFGGFGGGARGANAPTPQITLSSTDTSAAAHKAIVGDDSAKMTVAGTLTMPAWGGPGGFGGRGGGRGGRGGQGGAQPNGGGAPAPADNAGGVAPVSYSGGASARLADDPAPGDAQTPAAPPSGDQPAPGTAPAPAPMVLKLDGEVWLSSKVTLPTDPKASVLPSLIVLGQAFDQFLPGLTDKVNATKQIPLEAKLTFTRPARGNFNPPPTIGTISTTSVSADPLDASLFTVPADYTKIDTPAPTWGGRGGFGGRRGGQGGAPGVPPGGMPNNAPAPATPPAGVTQ